MGCNQTTSKPSIACGGAAGLKPFFVNMILIVRADNPKEILQSILDNVDDLTRCHQVLNTEKHERNKRWQKGENDFLILDYAEEATTELKLSYRVEGKRRLLFEFKHHDGHSRDDFMQFHRDLAVFLLTFHSAEFEEIKIINDSVEGPISSKPQENFYS